MSIIRSARNRKRRGPGKTHERAARWLADSLKGEVHAASRAFCRPTPMVWPPPALLRAGAARGEALLASAAQARGAWLSAWKISLSSKGLRIQPAMPGLVVWAAAVPLIRKMVTFGDWRRREAIALSGSAWIGERSIKATSTLVLSFAKSS